VRRGGSAGVGGGGGGYLGLRWATLGYLGRFLFPLFPLLLPGCRKSALPNAIQGILAATLPFFCNFCTILASLGPHFGAFLGCLGTQKVVKNHVFFSVFS